MISIFILCLEPKTDLEKRKELAILKRKRYESFRLTSGDGTSNSKEHSQSSFLDNMKKIVGMSSNKIVESRANDSKRTTMSSIHGENDEIIDYELDNDDEEDEDSVSNSTVPNDLITSKPRSLSDIKRNFQLDDIIDFVHKGIDTIIDDDVTKRFTTEGLIFLMVLVK